MSRPTWSARAHSTVVVVVVVAMLAIQPFVALGSGLLVGPVGGGAGAPLALTTVISVVASAAAWWLGRSLLVALSLLGIGVGSAVLAVALSGLGLPGVGPLGMMVLPLAIAVGRGPDRMRVPTPAHPTLDLAPPDPRTGAAASPGDPRPPHRVPLRRSPRLRASVLAAAGAGAMALQPLLVLEFAWTFSLGTPNPHARDAAVLAIAQGAVVATLGVVALALGRSVLLGVLLLAWGAVSAWAVTWFVGVIPALLALAIVTPIAVSRALASRPGSAPGPAPAPSGHDTPSSLSP